MKLTVAQFRTLEIIAQLDTGKTMLIPELWRDRHHQALLRRGLLRMRADPFKTKANMLRGRITKLGRKAVREASPKLRAAARAAADRDYAKLIQRQCDGYDG